MMNEINSPSRQQRLYIVSTLTFSQFLKDDNRTALEGMVDIIIRWLLCAPVRTILTRTRKLSYMTLALENNGHSQSLAVHLRSQNGRFTLWIHTFLLQRSNIFRRKMLENCLLVEFLQLLPLIYLMSAASGNSRLGLQNFMDSRSRKDSQKR
jgi:hypothetical protein